jgi:hypothetical protein
MTSRKEDSMKKLGILVVLLAGCASAPKAGEWYLRVVDQKRVKIERIANGKDLFVFCNAIRHTPPTIDTTYIDKTTLTIFVTKSEINFPDSSDQEDSQCALWTDVETVNIPNAAGMVAKGITTRFNIVPMAQFASDFSKAR